MRVNEDFWTDVLKLYGQTLDTPNYKIKIERLFHKLGDVPLLAVVRKGIDPACYTIGVNCEILPTEIYEAVYGCRRAWGSCSGCTLAVCLYEGIEGEDE